MSEKPNKIGVPRYAWVILALGYLCGINGSLILNKISPLVPDLMAAFDVNLGESGLLMSMYGLTGVLLALPSGLIIQRLGLKTAGMIAFACIISGATLGALSGSYGLLLGSRMLEGFGTGLILILIPAAIAMWFPPEKSGTPIGIWSTAIPVGGFLTLTIIPPLAEIIGWEGVWWISAGTSLLAMVAFWFLIRPAPAEDSRSAFIPNTPPSGLLDDMRTVVTKKSAWLLTLVWFGFGMVLTPIITFYPTFLATGQGYGMARAGFLVGLISVANVPSAPLAGWVSDFIGSRKWVTLAGLLILLPLSLLIFRATGPMIPVAMILMGLCTGMVTTTIFAAVPDAVGTPLLSGMGIALLSLGMSITLVVAPPIFGALVEKLGWATAAYFFAPFILIAMVAAFANKRVP
jgi:MFS family permease